jgi:DNA-binding IclR family transcriptional regulator
MATAEAGTRDATLSSSSKALLLLEVLARADGPIGVCEVATRAGLSKPTAHRLLKTLEEHQFVGRSGMKYRVGNRLFEMCQAARESEWGALRNASWVVLSELFEQTRSTVHLAVLEGVDVLYLEKITGAGPLLPTRVGDRYPATCTALGKAMLAFGDQGAIDRVLGQPLVGRTPYSVRTKEQLLGQLGEARQRGYAVEREEARIGRWCVAAPVVRGGRVLGAVSICSLVGNGSIEGRGQLVVDAARRIERRCPAEV